MIGMALKHKMTGSELIISPKGVVYHIDMARRNGFPSRFLLMGDPKRVEKAIEFLDGKKIYDRKENREFCTVRGKYRGVPVSLMGTGIGPDNTEIAIVESHAVLEYLHEKNIWKPLEEPASFVRAGTSGSPQKSVQLGCVAISKHAIGLDNTGLYYLHKPLVEYKNIDDVFYTPNDPIAIKIWNEVQRALPYNALQVIKPYVSTATPLVVGALEEAAAEMVKKGELLGFESGITTSAPGFFAPQGRKVGRLGNILIPDLQKRLATIKIEKHLGIERAANNEMETSVLLRLAGEILGYNVGAVCSVIANRAKGEFISASEFARSVDASIKAGLEALIRF